MMGFMKVARHARLGLCLPEGEHDPFWVQVYEAIYKRSQTLPVELIVLHTGSGGTLSEREQLALLEDIVAQELDVLIGWPFPEARAHAFLESGLAIVHVSETGVAHPLSVSPLGLRGLAQGLADFLARQLDGRGRVLVVGGGLQTELPDDGKSRLRGVADAFAAYPGIDWEHVPTFWHEASARPQLERALCESGAPFDALFGLSDTLALLARDVVWAQRRCRDDLKVVGINGDPIALAGILRGEMLATVETSPTYLGARAVELACDLAYGQLAPPHFGYRARLITAETVAQVAADRLASFNQLVSVPFQLRERERLEHLTHLETSLGISRQLSGLLDERELPPKLEALLGDAYGFSYLQLAYWCEKTQSLRVVHPSDAAMQTLSRETLELYRDVLRSDQLVFIPDQGSSLRYEQDSGRASTRSRVVLPIRSGGGTLGQGYRKVQNDL